MPLGKRAFACIINNLINNCFIHIIISISIKVCTSINKTKYPSVNIDLTEQIVILYFENVRITTNGKNPENLICISKRRLHSSHSFTIQKHSKLDEKFTKMSKL